MFVNNKTIIFKGRLDKTCSGLLVYRQSAVRRALNLLFWHRKRSHLQEGEVPRKGRPMFGLSVDGVQCFPTEVAMLLTWSNKVLFTQIKPLSRMKMAMWVCSINLCFDSGASLGASLCWLILVHNLVSILRKIYSLQVAVFVVLLRMWDYPNHNPYGVFCI